MHSTPSECPLCKSADPTFLRSYRATIAGNQAIFADLGIWQCKKCDLSFAFPPPSQQALDEYYRADYRSDISAHRLYEDDTPKLWSGASIRARSQVELMQPFVRQVTEESTSWLDIGAGHGYLLDEVRARGIRKTGAVEPAQQSQARLMKHGHETYPDPSQITTRWGVISFSHVLEHVIDPSQFLQQIRQILADRGVVYCEVPNEIGLQAATNDAPHLFFFTMRALRQIFESNQFEVVAIYTCGMLKEKQPSQVGYYAKRIGQRLLRQPPSWLDRALHPHFHYSSQGDRAWIRLIARKS